MKSAITREPIILDAETQEQPDNLAGLLGRITMLAGEHPEYDQVATRELLGAIGRRAYGPLLLAIGLFSISPATIVPGLTWASAVIVLALALQMMIGAHHPWLPAFALNASVSRRAVRAAALGALPWARRIDALLKPRLGFLADPPFVNIAGLFCALAALATFPLGLIPAAPLAPGSAVVLIGLGLTARDGLLLLFGGGVLAGAVALAAAAYAAL
jgi:hypothetical protein